MLNPIIYSFTVKEFKRSALRLVVPAWQFAHRCLPRIFPAPPDRIMQRMSRHGHRARNKTRHRSYELDGKKAGHMNGKACHKRRQTEPAVYGLQKKVGSPQFLATNDTTSFTFDTFFNKKKLFFKIGHFSNQAGQFSNQINTFQANFDLFKAKVNIFRIKTSLFLIKTVRIIFA